MYSAAVRLSASTEDGVVIACVRCHPGVINHYEGPRGAPLSAFLQKKACVQICMHSVADGTGFQCVADLYTVWLIKAAVHAMTAVTGSVREDVASPQ